MTKMRFSARFLTLTVFSLVLASVLCGCAGPKQNDDDCCWIKMFNGKDLDGSGFRDGKRSLHNLHVTDRRKETELGERVLPGISCRNCHNPHSTQNPRLVLEQLDCDGVPCLQLEYHKVGEGGRCLGGCHTRESYLPLP